MEVREDIVITGYAGSLGAAFITEERYEELCGCFRKSLLDEVISIGKAVPEEPDIPSSFQMIESTGAGRGSDGILTRLYQEAVKRRCGLCIELKKIPVRQMTVEICEKYGLNPYRIEDNCRIILTPSGMGHAEAERLKKEGLTAFCIGHFTADPAKIITDKTSIEYINRA